MKTQFLLAILVTFFSCFSFAESQGTGSAANPDIVVHLLDYLAKDYPGAVKDGKILSASEYSEQLEFAGTVLKTAGEVPSLKNNSEFYAQVEQLYQMIQKKAPEAEVSSLARKLQQAAIQLAGIEVAPKAWPDLAKGEKLYQSQCTACHGSSGLGDGAAGAALDPKPANFHDPELISTSSPFKFYNTIRLGVPGTGMASFSGLTDEEVWSLAFYLKSLGYEKSPAPTDDVFEKLSLKEVASLSDEELSKKLSTEPEANRTALIASLRTNTPKNQGPRNTLDIAESLLAQSWTQARSRNFTEANPLALRAYLEGIEPLEPKMKANVPGLTEQIESLMSSYRSRLNENFSEAQIQESYTSVQEQLKKTRDLLLEKKMSPGIAFGAAFSIFLREGFEAVLIIIVLLSVLKAMGQTQAMKWVHFGWILAVVLGVITWFASGLLLAMSGLSRELLEGSISILAVLVLLYVGFWLHRYSEAKKWRLFLEAKLKTSMHSGSYFVLALVAFMAVFREAFEVVLFLRAIWLDLDPSGQNVAGLGVLSSIAILMGLSYFAIQESRKLPVGKLFEICSWTMIALAFILAGKGIHSLQEAGMVGVTDLPLQIRADLIGFFPSVQTLLAQIIVVIVFGALLFADKPKLQAD
jgi:high-affinity iron transporter